jgi:hypothetical protein
VSTTIETAMITRSRSRIDTGPIVNGLCVAYCSNERDRPPKKYR